MALNLQRQTDLLLISDDSNSVFAHADITGCAITVTAML